MSDVTWKCCLCLQTNDVQGEHLRFVRLDCSHEICIVCFLATSIKMAIVCPSCWCLSCINFSVLLPPFRDTHLDQVAPTTNSEDLWCLNCAGLAKDECKVTCISSTIHLNGATLEQAEALQKKFESCIQTQTLVIKKRKETQATCDSILKALQQIEHDIREMRKNNNVRLEEAETFVSHGRVTDPNLTVVEFSSQVSIFDQKSIKELDLVNKEIDKLDMLAKNVSI